MDEYYNEYNEIAEEDLNKPFDKHKDKLIHKPIIKILGNARDKDIIDLGCANGLLLSKINCKTKTGVDIAIPYIKNNTDVNITIINQDIEKPINTEKKYDIILCISVLEHVLHPELVINNIKELSHKDTRIIIAVPYNEDLSWTKTSKYKYTHLRTFLLINIVDLFTGFKVKEFKLITPKNPFINKNVLLRKMFSFIVLFGYKPFIDWLFIDKLDLEASTLIVELERDEK